MRVREVAHAELEQAQPQVQRILATRAYTWLQWQRDAPGRVDCGGRTRNTSRWEADRDGLSGNRHIRPRSMSPLSIYLPTTCGAVAPRAIYSVLAHGSRRRDRRCCLEAPRTADATHRRRVKPVKPFVVASGASSSHRRRVWRRPCVGRENLPRDSQNVHSAYRELQWPSCHPWPSPTRGLVPPPLSATLRCVVSAAWCLIARPECRRQTLYRTLEPSSPF